jgi:hypothetical protein
VYPNAVKTQITNTQNNQFLPRSLASGQRDNEKTFCLKKKETRGEQRRVYIEITKQGFSRHCGLGLGHSLHEVE